MEFFKRIGRIEKKLKGKSTMGLRRHVLNIGTLIGIIIFITITIHFPICLWAKTDVFYIHFLRSNDVVNKLSFAIAILLLVIGGIIGAIAIRHSTEHIQNIIKSNTLKRAEYISLFDTRFISP